MTYIEQGGQRISEGVKQGDMMEVEAGNKLIEFGRKKQGEEKKRLTLLKKGKNYRLSLGLECQEKKNFKMNSSVFLLRKSVPTVYLLCLAV